MSPTPNDHLSARFPVAIKGVLLFGSRCVLLKNERREWELPGGKLEPKEDPVACLGREIEEELGVAVEVGPILDCWLYNILGKVEVVIVTYACRPVAGTASEMLRISHEHKELGLFGLDELVRLPMPDGYRASIRRAAALGR